MVVRVIKGMLRCYVQEELKHFEHKLEKHEVFKREADIATGGSLRKDKNNSVSSDQHKLQVKAKQYAHKVYHISLIPLSNPSQ